MMMMMMMFAYRNYNKRCLGSNKTTHLDDDLDQGQDSELSVSAKGLSQLQGEMLTIVPIIPRCVYQNRERIKIFINPYFILDESL
jgi:hypothetical protein